MHREVKQVLGHMDEHQSISQSQLVFSRAKPLLPCF